MADQTLANSAVEERILPAGEIVAEGVSADEYMGRYAGQRYEWVEGYVIKMSPVAIHHFELVKFLLMLFTAYFSLNRIGRVLGDPVMMRIDAINSRRQPDVMIVLDTNPSKITATFVQGPADICIEVISPGTEGTDYHDKFIEFEKGGVGEYWIFHPLRRTADFYRLNNDGVYEPVMPDTNDNYTTPRLPKFVLNVSTLWQPEMPDYYEIGRLIQAMLK